MGATAVKSDSGFEIHSIRPVVLPRGQLRQFDYRLLAPLPDSAETGQILLQNRLVSVQRGASHEPPSQTLSLMAEQEYFLVVLTNRPERFARLQVADWVRPLRDESAAVLRGSNYRIVIPPSGSQLPLAETMLDWTSTAVVLWDDRSADDLTPGQLQAIADWIRFGGLLIVNGAEAAEMLAASPLADVLPARPTARVELEVASSEQLLQSWSVNSDKSLEKQRERLRDGRARVASQGDLAADAVPLPGSGNLVLARDIGRGRVVQPKFDITGDWMVGWTSYDSFINAVVLGRPRRELVSTVSQNLLVASASNRVLQQTYPDLQTDAATSRINTRFRLAARDAALPSVSLFRAHPIGGLGSWSDDADLIKLADELLRSESGIEIPHASLVVRTLGIYLLLLVPLNYALFWMLGRVEYAWVAVPLIAVGGAVWVSHAARLDIGFARSQTEVALLEVQPEYRRGHLSRVVAIYNSLSTRYEVAFENGDSVAAPVRAARPLEPIRPPFRTSFGPGPILSGFTVASNQVRLFRAEQIVDVGGLIRREGDRFINGSSSELLEARVVERDREGRTRFAILGRCAPETDVLMRFQNGPPSPLPVDLPIGSARFLDLLADPESIPPGTSRLIARVDATFSGMTVSPAASQQSSQTILLVHLQHPATPSPRPDVNLIADFPDFLTEDQSEVDFLVDPDAENSIPRATP